MNRITQLDRHSILLSRDSASLHAERSERGSALRARVGVDHGIDAPTVAVHRHAQRTEVAHAKAPQALRMQVVEIDILDRLDPGRLQRGGAADDGEIRTAQLAKRSERA